MFEAATIVGLTSVMLVFHACLRRCRLSTLWLVFGIVPTLLAPAWAWAHDLDFFVWIKLLSVFGGLSWAAWLRFTGAGRVCLFRSAVPWILLANVGEAMTVDLLTPTPGHQLNVVAGLLLMLTIPFNRQSVRIDEASACRDLHFDLPISWIVGYTLWNWSFVMLNYPAYAGHHLAILLAAMVVGWVYPQLWLQARAATLGLNLLVYATNPQCLLSIHDARAWSNDWVNVTAPAMACIWMLVCVARASLQSHAGLARIVTRTQSPHACAARNYASQPG